MYTNTYFAQKQTKLHKILLFTYFIARLSTLILPILHTQEPILHKWILLWFTHQRVLSPWFLSLRRLIFFHDAVSTTLHIEEIFFLQDIVHKLILYYFFYSPSCIEPIICEDCIFLYVISPPSPTRRWPIFRSDLCTLLMAPEGPTAGCKKKFHYNLYDLRCLTNFCMPWYLEIGFRLLESVSVSEFLYVIATLKFVFDNHNLRFKRLFWGNHKYKIYIFF